MTPQQRQGAEQRTPLHVVRIVGSQAEDEHETYGNGRPGAWLLLMVFEIAVLLAAFGYLGWSLPMWWPAP